MISDAVVLSLTLNSFTLLFLISAPHNKYVLFLANARVALPSELGVLYDCIISLPSVLVNSLPSELCKISTLYKAERFPSIV